MQAGRTNLICRPEARQHVGPGKESEAAQLQAWIAAHTREFRELSAAGVAVFQKNRPTPPGVINRCVQLSEQLSAAHRVLAELTLGRKKAERE